MGWHFAKAAVCEILAASPLGAGHEARDSVPASEAGAPDLLLEGVSQATFALDRIIRLEDSYPKGTADALVQSSDTHASKLRAIRGYAV